jgi:CRP/FNR family transcriptional regulator
MTMTCCLGNTKSEIHAITDPAKLLMIPIGKWKNGPVNTRPGNFVFNSYHTRMMELLAHNIAFNNMDERLENYLDVKIKIQNSKHLYTTQKVVTTCIPAVWLLLKKMENNHKIKLHRFIEVL